MANEKFDTAHFDARRASQAQYQQRLAQLGIAPNPSVPVIRPTGGDDPHGDRIAQREQQRILDRNARTQATLARTTLADREAALGAGRIDARTADVNAVRARMKQLGLSDLGALVNEPPPAQPVVRPQAPDPTSGANRIESEARAWLDYANRGGRVTAEDIDDSRVFARYAALRYANVPGQWG